MQAIDGINKRFGSNQIHFAVQGIEPFSAEAAPPVCREDAPGFMRPHKIDAEKQA